MSIIGMVWIYRLLFVFCNFGCMFVWLRIGNQGKEQYILGTFAPREGQPGLASGGRFDQRAGYT